MATLEPCAVGDTSDVKSHSATAAMLSAHVETLAAFKDTVEAIPAKAVFESVVVILTLVKSEMIWEDPFVELARACAKACYVLKTVTGGRGIDNLSGLSRKQIEKIGDLGRVVRHIESAVSERANCDHDSPEHHPGHTKECLIAWQTEMWVILGLFDGDLGRGSALEISDIEQHVRRSIDAEPSSPASVMAREQSEGSRPREPAPSSFLDENIGPAGGAAPHVSIDSNLNGVDRDWSGSPLPPSPENMNHVSELLPILDPNKRALQRLVTRTVHQDELPSVIATIVSNVKASEIVECLQESNAQTFVDIMDEALDSLDFPPRIRRKCVRSLYKTCAGHNLLPRSLHFELGEDPIGVVLYSGGFGDVWKREYDGRDVAVKVLRPRYDIGSRDIINRFCKEVITWKALRHSNVLPLLGVVMTENRLAMVSEWMANGNISQFVKTHQRANRFELLGDVARGLIHMHGQGMIHGDLKGANILIDRTGHACLADFGLLTIASDSTNATSSNSFLQGGTYRWMSPELFDPDRFDLDNSRQTKYSDRYALGMVIYEVLSEQVPFSRHHGYAVVVKILKGERPKRPQGEGTWFVNDVWNTLERCWKPSPSDRPSIKHVLRCLERTSRSWTPPPLQTVACAPTAHSPTRNSETSTEESTDEGKASSPSEAASPHPSQEFPPKGLPYNTPGYQYMGTDVIDPSGSDSEESAGILDGAPPANILSRETPLGRQYTRNNREALWQSRVTPNERFLRGRSPEMNHVVGTHESEYNDKMDYVEAWEPNNPAFRGFTEKTSSRDIIAGKRRQPPDADDPIRALSQTSEHHSKSSDSLSMYTAMEAPATEFSSPSSSVSTFFTPSRSIDIPAPATSKQRGRISRRGGFYWDHIWLTFPRESGPSQRKNAMVFSPSSFP